MNGFECRFHDLRHTFATMMIANGCDGSSVKKSPQWGDFSEKERANASVAKSYLGHASVSMTLDIYADVDPDAKTAALDKVLESFDVESSFLDGFIDWKVPSLW